MKSRLSSARRLSMKEKELSRFRSQKKKLLLKNGNLSARLPY